MYHDHTWSVRQAIQDQIHKEDLIGWAQRKDPPPALGMVYKVKWKPLDKYLIGKSITRFASSLMP